MELQRPGQPVEITIEDKSKGVSVLIDPAKKTAVIDKWVGLSRELASMNPLDEIRSLILEAKAGCQTRIAGGEGSRWTSSHRMACQWRWSQ